MPVLSSSLIQRKHLKSIAYKGQNAPNRNKQEINRVRTEAERESLCLLETQRGNGASVWADQLPDGCDWGGPLCGRGSSVLWSEVVAVAAVLDGAETAGVMEEELTPLEVLTELC